MKICFYILVALVMISCTGMSKISKDDSDIASSNQSIKNITIVNQKSLDDQDILYCGDGYGMTPNQALKKAKKSALIEMSSSLASFVISNSSQNVNDVSGYSSIVSRLRDQIYSMNVIVDHQVVKYEEIEEFGGYRCKLFLSFQSKAARIIASERSEKLLQELVDNAKEYEGKENSQVSTNIGKYFVNDNNLNDLYNDIEFSEKGISKKEITNFTFAKYIMKISKDYRITCIKDTIYVEDIPLANGFHISDNRIIPKRFTENVPVLATPVGIKIFLKIINRIYYSSNSRNYLSLLSVKDYYSIYNDLGVRPYLTDYVFKGDHEGPEIKFIIKFSSKRIKVSKLMEYYSTEKNYANFFIKIKS
ncbi:MAG: hypothetical protein PF638_13915 [Candidatus Delongbacteria bacterium]|jgi:hypothetical protein|nr:hypothetical protein [Candidatus Delongbacteria bacterium]